MSTDGERLVTALSALIADGSPMLAEARSRAENIPERDRLGMENLFLSDTIEPLLKEYELFAGGRAYALASGGGGWSRMDPTQSAARLVGLARKRGAAEAVRALRKVLTTPFADARLLMLVHGVASVSRCPLSEGISICPLSEAASHREVDRLLRPWSPEVFLAAGGVPPTLKPPEAVLSADVRMEPFAWDLSQGDRPPDERPFATLEVVNDVRLALTCIGPCAPIAAFHWFEFRDPDLDEFTIGGTYFSHEEVRPMRNDPLGPFDPEAARRVVIAFLRHGGKFRQRLTRSLERLNQAIRRTKPGDSCVDLCTALEALLASGRGEHSFTVALRSALLAGDDLASRMRVRALIRAAYKIRNASVHKGEEPASIAIAGEAERPAREVVKEALVAGSNVIRRLIEEGEVRDWSALELTGGER